MAVLKCKMCGGDIEAKDTTYGTCTSCGTTQMLPKPEDEQKADTSQAAMPAAGMAGDPGAILAANVVSWTKRGFLLLEDAEWNQVTGYFNMVLDQNPEYAPAYIGLLCADLKVKGEAELINRKESFENNSHYKKALRFAGADYGAKIAGYNDEIKNRIKQELRQKADQIKQRAIERQNRPQNENHARQEHLESMRRVDEGKNGEQKQEEKEIIKEPPSKETAAQEKLAQAQNWKKQGLCMFCGGQMGGLLNKKCKVCGRQG